MTTSIDRYRVDATVRGDYVYHQGGKECWELVKKINAGGQALVCLEQNTNTRQLRAVKRISVDRSETIEDAHREIAHMIALRDYPNHFIPLLCWYEDRGYIYIATEYLEHGDLDQYLKFTGPMGEMDVKDIAKQLLEAIAILKERGIYHCDIKPQNVLVASLSPIRVKLADFGISRSTLDHSPNRKIGTRAYASPELVGYSNRNRQSGPAGCTSAADMWSFGCLVHKLLTSEIPWSERDAAYFMDPTEDNLFSMRCYGLYCAGRSDLPVDALQRYRVSDSGIDLYKRLMEVDPTYRITAVDALNHRWLQPARYDRRRTH